MSESSAARSVLMKHPVGLHARPSVKLTRLAKSFRCRIEGAARLRTVDRCQEHRQGHGAEGAARLHPAFPGRGEGAAEAVNALSALVARDFDEDHADAATS